MNYGNGRKPQPQTYRKKNSGITGGRIVVFCIFFAVILLACILLFNLFLRMGVDELNVDGIESESMSNTVSGESSIPLASAPQAEVTPEFEYATDLSDYMKYIDPENAEEYLLLVNYENVLDSSYAPKDLIDVEDTRKDRAKVKMREYAEKALEALYIDARALGYEFSVTSGYRDYNTQLYLFNNKVKEYAHLGEEESRAKASTIVAVPGTSEHQSGLCVDMHNLSAADVSFANEEEAVWLAENSYKYGFILRYPEDKQDITKISYEPWHFRYVGRTAAAEMYELDMCLEEYIEHLGK